MFESRVAVTYEIVAHHRDQTMVFDLKTGSIVKSLSHVAGSTMAAAISPNGESLLTACTDGLVRHWNSSDLELIQELPLTILENTFCSMSITFLDDNKFATGTGNSHWIWILTLDSKEQYSLQACSKVHCIAAISSMSLLAGLSNGNIEQWDVSSSKVRKIFAGHRSRVGSLAKINDALFASGSLDKTVKIWSMHTGSCIHTLSGHTDSVGAVVYLPNDKLLVTGSDDKSIKI
mmetsp:Transcript_27430/g.62986  ORF Transcript_27430/g.62986 Transcript_27430/m.62986 type:complete len:233 (+) Transcript_27430:1038-1736(+)